MFDAHIANLCKEHNIVRKVMPGRGRANVRSRSIKHPPITEEMAYFVALHEIGHVCVGMKESRLKREAAAWEWALDNALIAPDYTTRQRICACLWRYVVRAQINKWPLPEPDHMFWQLMIWWDPRELKLSAHDSDHDGKPEKKHYGTKPKHLLPS